MERSNALLPRATCTNDTDPGCKKPTRTPPFAIILAVVIPVVIAIIVMVFLHRRHLKKLKQEETNDPHKSLDFGMNPAFGGGKKKGRNVSPEMLMKETDPEKPGRTRGMSLEMDMSSPYILPAALHGSRESFHSMSRSMHDPDDPYRPVTFIKDSDSVRGGSSLRKYPNDTSSTYTGSSGGTDKKGMNDGLLQNAGRMSQSFPPRAESKRPVPPSIKIPEPVASPRAKSPLGPGLSFGDFPAPAPLQLTRSASPSVTSPQSEYRAGAFTSKDPSPPPAPSAQTMSPQQPTLPNVLDAKPVDDSSLSAPPLPRIRSQEAIVHTNPNTVSMLSTSSHSSYGEGFKITPPSPRQSEHGASRQNEISSEKEPQNGAAAPIGLGVGDLGFDSRRLSMSLRPLPHEDPNENPEERANRIRSFYKEYFDDSKPEPSGGHMYSEYYEDYGSEYLDGTVFDPETGNFVVARPQAPFAQPVTRRAMTPPPRAPPRFGPQGHFSNGSTASGQRMPGRPRGMSTQSTGMAAPQPRKPMPPPVALTSLPTPSKLKEDSMVFNAIDFAPPVSYRDRQLGRRPDSPLGNPRPFSPAVRPHTPLASSFDDLAVMPSPHLLRKSGTFTALDFAPPPRFRDPGSGGSDAGSIRSNRSGMSTASRMAVRAGAYRVSRIPKEVVGTKDDIMQSLRPTLDMVRKA